MVQACDPVGKTCSGGANLDVDVGMVVARGLLEDVVVVVPLEEVIILVLAMVTGVVVSEVGETATHL
jgi:hypothetical protein